MNLANVSEIEVQPPKYVKSELAWKGSGYLITASTSLLLSVYVQHPTDYLTFAQSPVSKLHYLFFLTSTSYRNWARKAGYSLQCLPLETYLSNVWSVLEDLRSIARSSVMQRRATKRRSEASFMENFIYSQSKLLGKGRISANTF